MNNRPIEKMLNPASINEYRRLSGEYGFDPFVIEPDFDQNSFIGIWNEQSKTAKKEAAYSRIREKYPELLLNKKGTSRISIYENGKTVYPYVRNLTSLPRKNGYIFDLPVYAPAWNNCFCTFGAPTSGMIRMGEKEVVKYLEWAQQRFGLFDILKQKRQNLDILLLNDHNTAGNGSAIALLDYQTQKIRMQITLSYVDQQQFEKPYRKIDYVLFHELMHILFCLRFNCETSYLDVPEKIDSLFAGLLQGYTKQTLIQKHELYIDLMTEGMLSGTIYESLFCPHKDDGCITWLARCTFIHFMYELWNNSK